MNYKIRLFSTVDKNIKSKKFIVTVKQHSIIEEAAIVNGVSSYRIETGRTTVDPMNYKDLMVWRDFKKECERLINTE